MSVDIVSIVRSLFVKQRSSLLPFLRRESWTNGLETNLNWILITLEFFKTNLN